MPGAAGLLASLAVLLLVEARYLRRDRAELETSPMGVGPVRGVAAVTVLLALSAVVVVLAEGRLVALRLARDDDGPAPTVVIDRLNVGICVMSTAAMALPR